MRTKAFAAVVLAILTFGSLSVAWTNRAGADWGRHSGWFRSGATVPAGSVLNVRLNEKISTEDARSGDSWSGTVTNDVVVDNRVMIPAGSPVTGVVQSAAQGTHDSRAEIDLALRRVTVNGDTRAINADTEPIVADSHRAKKIGAIVGGAAAGALLGKAIAGHNHGTLIGGIVGGAAGYGLTRHAMRTMQLKEGTVLSFTTREDMVVQR